MTRHRTLCLASLLASAGMVALTAAGAAAQSNSYGSYGGQGAAPPWMQSSQNQGGQYGSGTTVDRPYGPYTYGSSGPSYRGEPYEAGPMGPHDQQRLGQQQFGDQTGRAYGLGYMQGRMDVRTMAQQRIQQVGEELFELGFMEGLEAGLQNNPSVQSQLIERYGQNQFEQGYQQGRSAALASAEGGRSDAHRQMHEQHMQSRADAGAGQGASAGWLRDQQARLDSAFQTFQQDQQARYGGDFSARPGFAEDYAAWRQQQAQRLDQALAEWQAAQAPAASVVPGYQQNRSAASGQAAPDQMASSNVEQTASGPEIDVRTLPGATARGTDRSPAATGTTEQTASGPDIPVEPLPGVGTEDLQVQPSDAEQLLGRAVQSSDNEQIGQIDAVILSEDGSQIETLVVERADGFLMGIPVDEVQSASRQMVALDMTAQEIRGNDEAFRFEPSMNAVRAQN